MYKEQPGRCLLVAVSQRMPVAESDACSLRLTILVFEMVFHSGLWCVSTESVNVGDLCAWEDPQHVFHRYQNFPARLSTSYETCHTLNTSISKVQVSRVVG